VLLTLDKVTHLDQGLYTCVAENSEGAAETSAFLYVKGNVLNSLLFGFYFKGKGGWKPIMLM